MHSIEELVNIGSVLAGELKSVGINNYDDLKKTGAANALYKIKGESGKGCINLLYALEGAIKGIRWHNLSKIEKDKVKNELYLLIK